MRDIEIKACKRIMKILELMDAPNPDPERRVGLNQAKLAEYDADCKKRWDDYRYQCDQAFDWLRALVKKD